MRIVDHGVVGMSAEDGAVGVGEGEGVVDVLTLDWNSGVNFINREEWFGVNYALRPSTTLAHLANALRSLR